MAAMKLLHTADLHLGRTFHERSLIDDQRAVLAALAAALEAGDYAALVVAGDVYDRSIPSPEAVTLLGSFLAALRARFPGLAVVMLSGNHDSAERLGYGNALFADLGIHIVSDPRKSQEPIFLERGAERCAVFALPFLSPGAFGTEDLRSQRDLVARAAADLEEARAAAAADGAATVLAAHLFALGGREAESERAFLGTAERIDPGLFAAFDYVALGHLHRCQRVAANAWYSGSPLAYSFDEADQEKRFLSVEVRAGAAPEVTELPIIPSRRVRRLAGAFEDFNAPNAYVDVRDDYLELSLSDAHLVDNPLALLRSRYPNLLSIRQDQALSALGGEIRSSFLERERRRAGEAARRGAADDFADFLEDLYGSADPAKIELFASLAREAEDATA